MQKYFFIALGGALGSLARYWVGATIAGRMGTKFPYGTFVINITACVVIGFVLTMLSTHTELNPAWRFLIPIGFVGAYSPITGVPTIGSAIDAVNFGADRYAVKGDRLLDER